MCVVLFDICVLCVVFVLLVGGGFGVIGVVM